MSEPSWKRNVQASAQCPTDDLFTLTRRPVSSDRNGLDLSPGPVAHGADGLPAPGLLFLLADSVIGSACVWSLDPHEVIVTSSLHVEVHARPWADHGRVGGVGGEAFRYHGGIASSGTVSDAAGGVVASVSGRFAVFSVGERQGGNVADPTDTATIADDEPTTDPHPLLASEVYRTLGTRFVELEPDRLTLTFTARPVLANERHGLHGGSGALMGERACDALLRAVAPSDRDVRPVTMSAAFLRPIPADGSTVTCTARVEHLGRQLLAVQSVLHTPAGKPAVVVDVVAAGVERQP